jgi:hypothetical protein
MIEQLTEEQIARFPEFRDKWTRIGLRTGPADFEKAKEFLAMAYKEAGLEPPGEVLHMPSPAAGAKWEKETGRGEGLSSVFFGCHEAGWAAFYDYMKEVVAPDADDETKEQILKGCARLEGLMGLVETCGWVWMYDDVAVITDRPVEINRHLEGDTIYSDVGLDSESGPAVQYSDGYSVYAIRGVRVPGWVVEHPEQIDVPKINEETNAEVIRILIERYGEGKYMEEIGAQPKGEAFKGSQLFEYEPVEGVTLARVRAINSTPEPDGTSKIYWLKVPPGMSCTQEALAAIHPDPFRKDWREYDPSIET